MATKPKFARPEAVATPRANRRGRPKASHVAAIDEGILNAALEVFLECGYEAATMEAVAERARVSKGTLYARHPNKEALFRAVLQDRVDRWSALNSAQDHLLPSELGPRLRSRARTLQRMFRWPEFIHVTRLIETATASFPDLAAYWREIGNQRFLQLLADDIRSATPGGRDNAPDCDFLANLFLYTFSGWYRMESAARKVDEAEVSAFADQIIQIILTAIGSPAEAQRGNNRGPRR